MPATPRRSRADRGTTDRSLVIAGAIGATLAAVCCATLLLAVVLGSIGLPAWLAKSRLTVVTAVLFLGALFGLGFCRRHTTCRDPSAKQGDAG
jgi:mercuric ion transport protein